MPAIDRSPSDCRYRGVALVLGESADVSVRRDTIGPGAPEGQAAVAVADSNRVKIEGNSFVGGDWRCCLLCIYMPAIDRSL